MKYVIVLGDGMADHPVKELNHKTPLQCANLPVINYLAKRGQVGLVKTIPGGMSPGSDTANLSILGYSPRKYYSGRSPFEAASMGVEMKESDISFRCNLVTLSGGEPYEEKTLLDYSAGDISSGESTGLVALLNKHFSTDSIKFYPGVGYRHLMIWEDGPDRWQMTPPHDIIGKQITSYLPAGEDSRVVIQLMKESYPLLKGQEVNLERVRKGLNPANSIWIWGEGTRPNLPGFYDKYRLRGAVISAVDLIKGIAYCAGMEVIEVEGATGNIYTNFVGKAEAALSALDGGQDLVFIHIEAPDECSHHSQVNQKIKAIELIDQQVVRMVKEGLDRRGEDYSLLILPDHATPLSLRTHTSEPVPFLIYRSGSAQARRPGQAFSEIGARQTGILVEEGHRLMDLFLNKD
ncbi:MAG TPA: cofactor-independent phosphoglycerate mutase [Firmicutes bacterium]|nr:cofactor-independent phosphoglycerate mutase [Bacillota bacterium]